jgi:AcrR family transcriptional regulator
MAATLRQQQKAATRAKVLEAARVCFDTLGYDRATMRDIARKAGVSTGAIFASFPDKASLYRDLHGHPPVSPEVGAGLLNVVRRALAGNPLDVQMAAGLVAKVSEA